jgi:hypothetical protein
MNVTMKNQAVLIPVFCSEGVFCFILTLGPDILEYLFYRSEIPYQFLNIRENIFYN